MDIHYGEDIEVLYPMMLNVKSFAVIDKCYYYHRLRKSNQTSVYISDTEYLPKLYLYLRKIFNSSPYKELHRIAYCEVVGWVDRDAQYYNRKDITGIETLNQMMFDYIVIAIDSQKISNTVKIYLCDKGINNEKIVTL